MPAAGFNIEQIKLSHGWRARVLAGPPGRNGLPSGSDSLPFPTVSQWKPFLEQLIVDPAQVPGYALLKYASDARVLRARLTADESSIPLICKWHRVESTSRRFASVVRSSRAGRNFERALELLHIGLHTAWPLAIAEHGSLSGEAWLITEFVPGLVDLDDIALSKLSDVRGARLHRVKRGISEALVDLVDRLHRNGLTHRDLKASNILLKNWGAGPGSVEVYLVDLDGLRRRCLWRSRRRQAMLVRLAASLMGYRGITRQDYFRFLCLYLARHSASRGDSGTQPLAGGRRSLAGGLRDADGTVENPSRDRQGAGTSPPVRHRTHTGPLPDGRGSVLLKSLTPRVLFARLARQANAYRIRAQHRKGHKLDRYTGDV